MLRCISHVILLYVTVELIIIITCCCHSVQHYILRYYLYFEFRGQNQILSLGSLFHSNISLHYFPFSEIVFTLRP